MQLSLGALAKYSKEAEAAGLTWPLPSICPWLSRRNLVPDAFSRDLALELRERQQNVQGQAVDFASHDDITPAPPRGAICLVGPVIR